MSFEITITEAGVAALVNANNTGTNLVNLTEMAFGTGQYTPAADATSLQAEHTRLSTVGGTVVSDNTINITVQDATLNSYQVGEFGVYTDTGILFAVYSTTAGWITQKAASSTLLLSVDIVLSLSTAGITFADTVFQVPPATTEVLGVVELATVDEHIAGTDTTRVVTPEGNEAHFVDRIAAYEKRIRPRNYFLGQLT